MMKFRYITLLLLILEVISLCSNEQQVSAFRLGSEKLKTYTRIKTEQLLDSTSLESIYWPNEPLSATALAKVSGLNITLAETHFDLKSYDGSGVSLDGSEVRPQPDLIRDIFVTISAERDRSYTLTINLELNNPFKIIELRHNKQTVTNTNQKESGSFKIRLPQSTFLVQLSQRIDYDECLTVDYVQLVTNIAYDITCDSCTDREQEYLDKSFSKRLTQLDAQLDALLSEKLLLGLRTLLSQQRLDLNAYISKS